MSEVVESSELLRHLVRDRALRNNTYRGMNVPGLRVERGDFGGATFERITMGGSDLTASDLSRVTFRQVDARRVAFGETIFCRVGMADSDFTEASFASALVEDVTAERTTMMNVAFEGAKLTRSRFSACNLYGARLQRAVVRKCTFTDPPPNAAAALTKAVFAGAALIDCDLRGANLYRTDFRGALVVRCDLRGVILTAAQVEDARLVGRDFTGADLPDGLRSMVMSHE